MSTEKHVLPDTGDSFSNRIKKGAENSQRNINNTIFGPDNRPLSKVDLEAGKELAIPKIFRRGKHRETP